MEYNNPNDPWMYDPYKGLDDDERMKAGCLQLASYLVMIFIGLLLCALFSGCATTKYVPMPEVHTEHHWHTDSVKERDSVHTENTTIIRELDSAAMARYGIQMQANQRAWLVLQREMEQRLRELEHMTAQRDTVHDSIPVPYPVEVIKEVPEELSWWQRLKMKVGGAAIILCLLAFLIWVWRTK